MRIGLVGISGELRRLQRKGYVFVEFYPPVFVNSTVTLLTRRSHIKCQWPGLISQFKYTFSNYVPS